MSNLMLFLQLEVSLRLFECYGVLITGSVVPKIEVSDIIGGGNR